jgi:hypothetical protein
MTIQPKHRKNVTINDALKIFLSKTFFQIINLVFERQTTSHQLNRVVRHVKNKRNRDQYAIMLFLEKSFDSDWHEALLHKLIQGGCNIFPYRIIHYLLGGHTFQVNSCVCKLHSACINQTRVCRYHTRECHIHTHICQNYSRVCGNHTLRVEIAL